MRTHLGEAAFDEAWVVGKAMTPEQAIAYALEDRSPPSERTAAPETAPTLQTGRGLLSERELEVLCLIADGLSNREIAEQLVLAVRTVKGYINAIFGKLHVTSLTQAIARARALKLLS